MPVTIVHLRRDRRSITIPVGDDTITVTYRPSGFTPTTEIQYQELAKQSLNGAAICAILSDCLVEWDLLGEDGKPYPITREALNALPLTFLSKVLQAVMEDMYPNPPSGGTSAGG